MKLICYIFAYYYSTTKEYIDKIHIHTIHTLYKHKYSIFIIFTKK